jgi:tetratricopeptide (TPR) repeat protein
MIAPSRRRAVFRSLGRAGVAGTLVLALTGLARGEPAGPEIDPRMLAVRKACAAGEVDRGIEILAEIYAETKDITAVYNQGRCYQQNGRSEEALNRFREVLRRGDSLSAADRSEVEGFIRELQADLAARRTAHETPREGGPTPSRSLGPQQIAGLTVAGVGVVALGVGLYCSLKVRALSQQIHDTTAGPRPDFQAIRQADDDGRRYQRWQYVGYGVGAGALIAGAALYWFGGGERHPDGKMALAPAIGPGQLAASWRVSY